MNEYLDIWEKFMGTLQPKEYYELTLNEAVAMLNEYYVQNYLGEVSNTEEWVEKWLNEKLNR